MSPPLTWPWSCCNFAVPFSTWRTRQLPLGWLSLHFWIIAVDSPFISDYAFLKTAGSLVAVWIRSFATAAQCSLCSGNRSHKTNFAMTCFMPRSCIKILDTVVSGIPRSPSSSLTVTCLSLLPIRTHSIFSGDLLFQAFQSLDHFQQILNHLWSIFATLLFVLHSLHHPWNLLNYLNSFCRVMVKLNAKFDADLLLCLLSHFECYNHTIHVLTQWHLLPNGQVQCTSHCSHMCIPVHRPWLSGHVNIAQNILHYINNGWTFSRQSSYVKIGTTPGAAARELPVACRNRVKWLETGWLPSKSPAVRQWLCPLSDPSPTYRTTKWWSTLPHPGECLKLHPKHLNSFVKTGSQSSST